MDLFISHIIKKNYVPSQAVRDRNLKYINIQESDEQSSTNIEAFSLHPKLLNTVGHVVIVP